MTEPDRNTGWLVVGLIAVGLALLVIYVVAAR